MKLHKEIYRIETNDCDLSGSSFDNVSLSVGHKPTLHEAARKLAHLRKHGSNDEAFGWDHLAETKICQAQRCA